MGETKRMTVKREPRPREEKLLPGLSTLSGTSQSSVPSLAPRAVRTSRPEGYPGSLTPSRLPIAIYGPDPGDDLPQVVIGFDDLPEVPAMRLRSAGHKKICASSGASGHVCRR